jgi:hypothetical protein
MLAVIGLVLGFREALATAGFEPCDGVPAEVAAECPEDRRLACKGAGDAIAFFRSADLKVATTVRLRIVQRFPPQVTESAAGCFIERDGIALMHPYARFQRERTWFQVPVEPELYRSLAAHEAAHVIAASNFSVSKPTIQATEYIAYVVMFEVMDPDLRSRISSGYPALGITSAERLTELLCLADPMRFGIESYRYHTRPEVGLRFLRLVLDGTELSD